MKKAIMLLGLSIALFFVFVSAKASDNVKIFVCVSNDAYFPIDVEAHVSNGDMSGGGSGRIPARSGDEFEIEFGLSRYYEGNYFYVECYNANSNNADWMPTHSFTHKVTPPQNGDEYVGALFIDVDERGYKSIFYYDYIGVNDYYWEK